MAAIMSLASYRLDLEWLLAWFPIQGNSALENQKMRAGTLHHLNTEEPFASGGAISYMLGQGQDGDPLSPNNVAIAFITISVNEDHAFSLALEAHLGKTVRHGSLLAPPNVRLPFMLNIVHPGGDPETQGTALSLYGTIATTKRPLDFIAGAFQSGKIATTISEG